MRGEPLAKRKVEHARHVGKHRKAGAGTDSPDERHTLPRMPGERRREKGPGVACQDTLSPSRRRLPSPAAASNPRPGEKGQENLAYDDQLSIWIAQDHDFGMICVLLMHEWDFFSSAESGVQDLQITTSRPKAFPDFDPQSTHLRKKGKIKMERCQETLVLSLAFPKHRSPPDLPLLYVFK